MTLEKRVICSTITLRHLPLEDALREITALGFTGIDLGALPGVCDHVPYTLDGEAVRSVAATVRASGLQVRSINADVGDLNEILSPEGHSARIAHVWRLVDLAVAIGAEAIVLPNGRSSHDPVTDLHQDLHRVASELAHIANISNARGIRLWVEAPHWFRLVFDLDRTAHLLDLLPPQIGVVCDVSHITASGSTPRQFLERFGSRTRHVHIRDAEAGFIHHSVGRGEVDFPDLVAELSEIGYTGDLSLELETRDTADDDRPAEALRAGEYLSALLRERPVSVPVPVA